MDEDLNKLMDKYIKIMDWDIPDIDEPKARISNRQSHVFTTL